MNNLRKVIGVLLLFGVLNPNTASTARADDVHVDSDEIFSFSKYPDTETYSWYSSATINGNPVYLCTLSYGKLNEIRRLTPPIKELAVTFETETTNKKYCPSFYGRLVAISPSGQRVTPDSQNRKAYFSNVCDEYCVSSSERKQYTYLGCSAGWCYQNLFFYYLNFPVGTEPGAWKLELTIYYEQSVKVDSVTTKQNFKKVILLPEALEIVATTVPTTTITTTTTTSTTTTSTTTAPFQSTPMPKAIEGRVCTRVGVVKKVGLSTYRCTRSGKQLKWRATR